MFVASIAGTSGAITPRGLVDQSETCFRELLKSQLTLQSNVYLYGSHARGSHWRDSDYDLWIDAEVSPRVIAENSDLLEESFVPLQIDLVTTPQLRGAFAEAVKREEILWM